MNTFSFPSWLHLEGAPLDYSVDDVQPDGSGYLFPLPLDYVSRSDVISPVAEYVGRPPRSRRRLPVSPSTLLALFIAAAVTFGLASLSSPASADGLKRSPVHPSMMVKSANYAPSFSSPPDGVSCDYVGASDYSLMVVRSSLSSVDLYFSGSHFTCNFSIPGSPPSPG